MRPRNPSTGYSPADVVRLAWSLLLEADWRCDQIATHFTERGIRTYTQRHGGSTYTKDGQERPLRALYPCSVIYHLFTNPVYKGERHYRAKDGSVHVQQVPAFVTPAQWDQAQSRLAEHRRWSHRNVERTYLLRGLMRCAQCGAVYVGAWSHQRKGTDHRYYQCSTKHYQAHYYTQGTCVAAPVNADAKEAEIWADIEHFIRNPGATLLALAAKQDAEVEAGSTAREQLAELQAKPDAQQAERDSVLALYRRQRISEHDLDRQLDAIATEERGFQRERERLLEVTSAATTMQDRLVTARTLLARLHARLDTEPVTPALQREMIEAIVVDMRVETVEVGPSLRGRIKRRAKVQVTYAFDTPAPGPSPPITVQTSDESRLACRSTSFPSCAAALARFPWPLPRAPIRGAGRPAGSPPSTARSICCCSWRCRRSPTRWWSRSSRRTGMGAPRWGLSQ